MHEWQGEMSVFVMMFDVVDASFAVIFFVNKYMFLFNCESFTNRRQVTI